MNPFHIINQPMFFRYSPGPFSSQVQPRQTPLPGTSPNPENPITGFYTCRLYSFASSL